MPVPRPLSAAARGVFKTPLVRWYAVPTTGKDIVKDLYLQELRKFKPSPAPSVDKDVAVDLASYDIPEEFGAAPGIVSYLADKTPSTYPIDVIYEEECKEWEIECAKFGPVTAGDRRLGLGYMAPPQFHV